MKIIRNNLIPPNGFIAINLFGVLFVRGNKTLLQQTVVHEQIHTKQMKEMLYVFFYLLYVLEWIIRLLVIRNPHKAYRSISFEQEARVYQQYAAYPYNRPHYSWMKYLTKNGIRSVNIQRRGTCVDNPGDSLAARHLFDD